MLVGAALSFGVAGGTGFAGLSQACGVACPCEELVPFHGDRAADSVADPFAGCPRADACGSGELPDPSPETHRPGPDQRPDPCPDVCQDCACCPGAVAATLVLPVELAVAQISLRVAVIDAAPTSAGRVGVFRPPRSRC